MSRGPRWAPTFVPIDDPARWSWPIGRMAGVAWRVHAAMGLWAGVVLLRVLVGPLRGDPAAVAGPVIVLEFAALLVAVIVHEAARVWATRRAGPPPLSIALWPLGGLGQLPVGASPRSRRNEALGGLVALAIMVILAGLILTPVAGGGIRLAFGPLGGPVRPDHLPAADASGSAWAAWMAWIIAAQRVWVTVLLLHLLPMRPFDGGRWLAAIVSSRRGTASGDRIAAQVGLAVAGLTLLGGVLLSAWLVVLGAAVGGAHAVRRFAAIDAEAQDGLPLAGTELARAIGPRSNDDGLGLDMAGAADDDDDASDANDDDANDADDDTPALAGGLDLHPDFIDEAFARDQVAEDGFGEDDFEDDFRPGGTDGTETADTGASPSGGDGGDAASDRGRPPGSGPGSGPGSDPGSGSGSDAGSGPGSDPRPGQSPELDPDHSPDHSPELDPDHSPDHSPEPGPEPTLDEILGRIADVGMAGLTEEERAILNRETELRRRGG